MFMANVKSSAYDQIVFIMHFLSTLTQRCSIKFFAHSKIFQFYNYVQSNVKVSLLKCAKCYTAQPHNDKKKEVTKGMFLD